MSNEFGSDRMWGLKELPLPEPVSWVPSTPGWLAVAVILLGIGAWLAWRRWRAWQRERYRREALARLANMAGHGGTLAALPLVLRATALAAFPRSEVASLRGSEWLRWLNDHGARFEPGDAERLDRLPYDTRVAAGLSPDIASRLLAASRDWVRGHDAER